MSSSVILTFVPSLSSPPPHSLIASASFRTELLQSCLQRPQVQLHIEQRPSSVVTAESGASSRRRSSTGSSKITRFSLVHPNLPSIDTSMSEVAFPSPGGSTSTPTLPGKPTRQRSHPFMNLTFTALHDRSPSQTSNSARSPATEAVQHHIAASISHDAGPEPGQPRPRSTSSTQEHPADLPRKRNHVRTASTTSVPSTLSTDVKRISPSASISAPSSPRIRPRSTFPLDPGKEYFFTPGTTPVVVPPASPRLRKRSHSSRSVPTSPVYGMSPVNSMVNLASLGSRPLVRSPSAGAGLYQSMPSTPMEYPGMAPLSQGADGRPEHPAFLSSGEDDEGAMSFSPKGGRLSKRHARKTNGTPEGNLDAARLPPVNPEAEVPHLASKSLSDTNPSPSLVSS